MPLAKAQPDDFEPPPIFDIDASAKPGEGSGQRNGRKAAGAEEDDDDLLLDGKSEPAEEALDEAPARQVDYFA
jgi:hypothetical protein